MSRLRTHKAAEFLIRTFCPGESPGLAGPSKPSAASLPRSWSAKLEKRGERVIILFDLPDSEARRRAEKAVRSAPSLAHATIGGKAIREIAASIEDSDTSAPVLRIDALLGRG